ncbi:MAG: ABC transporter ATP-binding protein [Candidatus Coatesbacteria bacterium]
MAKAQIEPSYFWRFFREFILPHRTVVSILIANILVRVTLGLWWPYANKTMVDRVLVSDHWSWSVGVVVIVVGACILFANSFLVFLFNRVLFRLLVVVTQRSRTVLADHMLKLSQKFYDGSHAGRLLMTAVGDPGAITHVMTAGMINALANALIVLGGYVILIRMSLPLTLAITAVFPGMIAAFFWLRPKMRGTSEKIRENWGILCGMVVEKVGAVRVVRSFAAEDYEAEKFGKRAFLHRDLHVEYNRYSATYGFINGLLIHIGFMIVFVYGGYLYLRGQATLGTIVAFYGYFGSLFPAVIAVCNLPQMVAQASGSLTKVFRLLDEPIEIASAPGAPRLTEPVREIVFEKVSFRYGPALPWSLRNVSVTMQAGRQVGIIGPSGCGKSTLMALMLRYYDPTEGRILLNGRDLREWELASVRRAFGLVPQDVVLFSGTIRENVLYTQGARDDAAIWKALDDSMAADFVREHKGGLETVIGERGVSLSGGQKQRLSIARALLTDPEILVLDSAMSALDGETEQRLLATLRSFMKGGTAVIVSHRVGSVASCDRILVMDAGRIVEEGPPAELRDGHGYFADIYRQQAALSPSS